MATHSTGSNSQVDFELQNSMTITTSTVSANRETERPRASRYEAAYANVTKNKLPARKSSRNPSLK